MREKLSKYLSGEREGFSLVELIIVIAIMAILIGVVALAVLPYLNKSRESKDITTLDNVLSALTSSVGTTKAQGQGTITISDGTKISDSSASVTGTDAAKVQKAMAEVLGDATIDMESQNANGNTITASYDASTNKMSVKVNTTSTTSDGAPYEVNNG